MDKHKRIPLSSPHMGDQELTLLTNAFESTWIAPVGPMLDRFEKDFGGYIGSPHALAISSGTAGLHLALRAAGVSRGDVVLCSSLSFIASATPIIFQGAEPIFIDSETLTWNLDPELVEECLKDQIKKNKRPKAVIAVHIAGQAAQISELSAICKKYDVCLVEDAAESVGSFFQEKHLGTFGDFGAFSFNGNKIITTSGGGMLVSNNKEQVDYCRYLSTQAKENGQDFIHKEVGYNYRMSNLLAAVGIGQLQIIEQRVARRREIFQFYQKAFAEFDQVSFQPELPDSRPNRWLTVINVPPEGLKCSRDELLESLAQQNIDARAFWLPLHKQPAFQNSKFVGKGVCEELSANGVCLPSGTTMDNRDLDRVVEVIKKHLN